MNDTLSLEATASLLSGLFGIDRGRVVPGLALNGIPEWDSIAHLNLMMCLEANYGIEISEETIMACATAQGIARTIGPRG